MDYLLDSNIIIIYSRDNNISNLIEQQYQLFSDDNHRLFISVVSLGEINAIIKKLKLGVKRKDNIQRILSSLNVIGINFAEIIEKYGDIDAYSQGKLPNNKGKFTARNMGKNDLWIAATSSAYDLVLLTADKDFEHLDNEYLTLEYINLTEISK